MKYTKYGLLGVVNAARSFESSQSTARETVLGWPFTYSDNGFVAELDGILVEQNNLIGDDQHLKKDKGGVYQITNDRFEKSKEFQSAEAEKNYADSEFEDPGWQYSQLSYSKLSNTISSKLALMMIINQDTQGSNPVPLTKSAKSTYASSFSSLPNYKSSKVFKDTEDRFQV